jgi:hypothetical protein
MRICPFCLSRAVRVAVGAANRTDCVCNRCSRQWATVEALQDATSVADSSSGAVAGPPTNPCVWRLIRSTGHPVECRLATAGRRVVITVSFIGEALLTESHSDASEARARAAVLRERLLAKGWRTADVAGEAMPPRIAVNAGSHRAATG